MASSRALINPMLPTIVAVPGMWHPASCFDDLALEFNARGFAFESFDAPGVSGQDPFLATVDLDAQQLRHSVIEPLIDQGKDVLLLMHSYGGVYGSAAIEGLSKTSRLREAKDGGILGLVYITSVIPTTGSSLMSMMNLTLENLPPHTIYSNDTGYIQFINPEKHMYHDIPEESVAKWISKLRPQAFGSISTAVSYSPLADDAYTGRFGYVFCGSDRILPMAAQEYFANFAGDIATVSVNDATHAFFVGHVKEVVDAVVKLLLQLTNVSPATSPAGQLPAQGNSPAFSERAEIGMHD